MAPSRGRPTATSATVAMPNTTTLHLFYDNQDFSNEPVSSVHQGLMDLRAIVDLPDDATYYLCGPLPFMQAVRSALIERGVAPGDIQYEVFGPDLWQADLD
jgi:nitric oxide dioxygenase